MIPVTSYTIKGRLPGLNDMIKADRTHWAKGSQLKKDATELCRWEAVKAGLYVFEKPVFINVTWIEENRRRDLDNIRYGIKFILDGLVQAKKIPNDSQKWVRGISDYFLTDPKDPRIIISLRVIRP